MTAIDRLIELCSELLETEHSPQLAQIRDGLQGPLRVAVAGRLNAGKSTIVNALIGERIAPVDNRECTRLVTWYRYGAQESVVVERWDGTTERLSLASGRRIPADVDADPDGIRRIVVTLSNAALRAMTLIDTPGTQTTSTEVGRESEAVLGIDPGSRSAVAEADATAYLLTGLRATDIDNLRKHLRGSSPATCLGLLSKVDRIQADDPLAEGRILAERFADQLRGLVWNVEPVIGLAAETAECGRITEGHAQTLRALLVEPAEVLHRQLLSADEFERAGPESRAARVALVERFGLYGLRRILVEERRSGTAADYVRWARAVSNIEQVRATIGELFGDRAELMKTTRAIAELRRLAFGTTLPAAHRDRIRDELDRLGASRDVHAIRELELLNDVRRGGVRPRGDALPAELERVLGPGTVLDRLGLPAGSDSAAVRSTARDGAIRWRRIAADDIEPLGVRRAAPVVERTYRHLEEAV